MAGTALAAGIEEVTVTAQKREENLQTTPIAISALSADALQNLGITGFDGIAKSSPSIAFTPYPSSTNLLILYMRGQGVSDAMQITSDGSVGMYSDGFYMSRPQAATADIADIERVEVLRGPQGTLYGRNTTGGAVNLISKKPTGEFGFKQDFSFGTRDYFRSLTTVNLPKWNEISTKFTILKSDKDGWVKNEGSAHDFGEESQKAGRFSLRWTGLDSLTVDYFLEKGNFDSTPSYYRDENLNGGFICTPVRSPGCYDVFSTPTNTFYNYGNQHGAATRTYRPIDLPLSTSSFESHGLTAAWDVTDSLQIKSLTGYREIDWHAYQDYAEAFSPASTFPVSFTTDDLVRSHQFSQEFQFIGNFLDNQFKYVGGLYYFREGASHREINNIDLPFYYSQPGIVTPTGSANSTFKDRYATVDAKSQAVYAQLTWVPPILDNRLDITAGARYTKDDRSADRSFIIDVTNDTSGVVFPIRSNKSASQSFKRFNPALTVNYNWTDDLSTYVKAVTGYKAGGFSESGPVYPVDNFDQGFKPEKVVTLEAGLKSYWLDRRVRFNVAVFQNKFDDLQLGFTVDSADSSVVQAYNAGKATIKGVEAELLVQPIDDLSISIDYAYLHSELDSVKALAGTIYDPSVNPGFCPSGPACNQPGDQPNPYHVGDDITKELTMPYAPKNKVNLGTDYTFLHFDKGTLAAHVDYVYQSAIFNTAPAGQNVPGRDFYEQPGYGLLNGRLTMAMDLPRGDKAKISLWGKNLAHHEYKTQVIGNGAGLQTPAARAGYNSQAAIWAEPASYGIDLTYEY